jgi:hypothetical protein
MADGPHTEEFPDDHKPPGNEACLFDVHGNVWEWMQNPARGPLSPVRVDIARVDIRPLFLVPKAPRTLTSIHHCRSRADPGIAVLQCLEGRATLIQTDKIKDFPLVLVGKEYWRPLRGAPE